MRGYCYWGIIIIEWEVIIEWLIIVIEGLLLEIDRL